VLLIPKVASTTFRFIAEEVLSAAPAELTPIAFIREPIERFISAASERPALKGHSFTALLDVVEEFQDRPELLDVHLAPQKYLWTEAEYGPNAGPLADIFPLEKVKEVLSQDDIPRLNPGPPASRPLTLEEYDRAVRLYNQDCRIYRKAWDRA